MLETAEVGSKITKQAFREEVPQLRLDLINAQFDLLKADFPVIVVLAGDDRIGANAVLNRLHEWMDARYLDTHVFGAPAEEEAERPRSWRYWRALPAHGRIGIFGGAWPLLTVAEKVQGKISKDEFERRIQQIRAFEGGLVDDGALVLKFWIHLSEKNQKKRLRHAKKDPDAAWWIEEADWRVCRNLDDMLPVAERMLKRTNSESAPWHVIEGANARYRDLTVACTIRDAVVARLGQGRAQAPVVVRTAAVGEERSVLDEVDLTAHLDRAEYEDLLQKWQARIHRLSGRAWRKGISPVLVFEGWDAGGKGGAIRRITQALPARAYRVVSIAAPTEEEWAHHYLWRFWRRLPRAGRMIVFDRSWYGRVLVERVERFTPEWRWRQGYDEINDFEEQLVEHGWPVVKLWLHISADEQEQRFEARKDTPYKQYKITDEDYRNREKWPAYVEAVDEMVGRTSTPAAPWHLVPANDKKFARIAVLKTVYKALKKAL